MLELTRNKTNRPAFIQVYRLPEALYSSSQNLWEMVTTYAHMHSGPTYDLAFCPRTLQQNARAQSSNHRPALPRLLLPLLLLLTKVKFVDVTLAFGKREPVACVRACVWCVSKRLLLISETELSGAAVFLLMRFQASLACA